MNVTTQYPPISNKKWELAGRRLTASEDLLSLAGWFGRDMGTDDELPPFDYDATPALTDSARDVVDVYKKDDDSTREEIRQIVRWALWAHRISTDPRLPWATRVMKRFGGSKPSGLVEAYPELAKALVAFEQRMERENGFFTSLLAAALTRYLGSDIEDIDVFASDMRQALDDISEKTGAA
jgi:hypothetical protein